jgi:uncharacterized membrane protein
VIERFLPGALHLQNLHPLFVHFPIAFLYGAALLYLLASIKIRASELLKWSAFWMLMLAAAGAAASIATGLYAEPGVMVAESVRNQLLKHHKHLMLTASAMTAILTIWAMAARPMPSRGRYVFLAALLAVMVLIAAGADFGGRMVYDYNAGGAACPQPIDFSK